MISRDADAPAAYLPHSAASPMNFLSNPVVARLLWALPLLLVVISVQLVRAGVEQREVSEAGVEVQADVLGLDVRERSEITHGMVHLRYSMPSSADSVERYVELPLAFLKEIESAYAEDSSLVIPLRVSEGSDQVVLNAYPRVQWVMTFAFAAMAAVGAIGLAVMVRGWNRFLATEGDPALREPEDAEPLA